MEVQIREATKEDLFALLEVQRAAFQQQIIIYQDCCLPPLLETEEMLQEELQQKKVLVALSKDKIIGSIRAYQFADVCNIERLSVAPDFMRKGVGTILMAAAENLFSEVEKYSLFTGHKSIRSLLFYKGLGYRVVGRSKPQNSAGIPMVFLEKLTHPGLWHRVFSTLRAWFMRS